jgi:phosphatidylethanolamine/phosphatidyl-N-methylethanolamine N-methyltransferase
MALRDQDDDIPSPELEQLHTPHDFGDFFRSWIRDPRGIGACAPSGRALAKLMATGVAPGAKVLELGAGTGTVTEALLARGVQPSDLFLVECNRELARILQRRFPRCQVIVADALALDAHLAPPAAFDFVISGLPLLLFSIEQRLELLRQVLALLGPRGVLHQFTYGGRCPIERELRRILQVDSELLGIAALNLPPAFVYRLARCAE